MKVVSVFVHVSLHLIVWSIAACMSVYLFERERTREKERGDVEKKNSTFFTRAQENVINVQLR